jgi:hypothetical protein
MTACDVVELVSAAALWVVASAYHEEIWRLPKVGPFLFTAALLASAAVLTSQAATCGPGPDFCPRLLLLGAQTCALLAAWQAYHHAPVEKDNGRS